MLVFTVYIVITIVIVSIIVVTHYSYTDRCRQSTEYKRFSRSCAGQSKSFVGGHNR